MHHDLKIWPKFFDAVQRGDKPFEVRKNDRSFAVGDTLVLKEWEPDSFDMQDMIKKGHYTGRVTEKLIVYVMKGGQFGIGPDYAVLGIR